MREKIRKRKTKDYERGEKEELRKRRMMERRSRDGEEKKNTERKKKGRFMELTEEGR